jgi:hypothetical protein
MNYIPYVPIFSYLTQSDGNPTDIPSEDSFLFVFHQSSSSAKMNIRKSLACFLSSIAIEHIQRGFNYLTITSNQSNFNPDQIKAQMTNLLSGSPLLIDDSNYSLFQSIFQELGNKDYEKIFHGNPPIEPTEFYLSIFSLKPIPIECLEKKSFQIPNFPQFSIPIGLLHLFFEDESDFLDIDYSRNNSNIITAGIEYFNHF